MPDKVSVKVNLNGVEEALLSLGPKIAKRLLRRAMKAAGIVMVSDIKEKAPVDKGGLRDSIDYVIKTSNSSDRASLTVGPTYDSKALKNSSSTTQSPGIYAMFVEFGLKVKKYTKHPFMRPAFDTNAEKWIGVFAQDLKENLEDAVK